LIERRIHERATFEKTAHTLALALGRADAMDARETA
jgi:hypothetical protein